MSSLVSAVDPCHPLVRRQRPGDGGDRVAVAEALGQVLGDVLGGVDEPAEDHRVVPVEQQLLRRLLDQLELLVVGAFERRARAAKRCSRRRCGVSPSDGVGVRAGRRVGGLDGLLVGQVQDGGTAEPVGLGHVLGVQVVRPGGQRRGGRPRRRGQRPQQRQGRPVPHPLPEPPPSGSRTVSRAYARTSSNSSLYSRDSAYLRSWVSRSSGNGVDSSRYLRMSARRRWTKYCASSSRPGDRLQVHVRQARLAAGRAGCGSHLPCRCAGWR